MNKLQTKALLLLLVGSLASSSACGSSGTSSDTTASQGGETTTEVSVTESEYKNPGVNYNGKEFPIAVVDWNIAWKINDYHHLSEEENGDVINDSVVKANRMVEETLNVDLTLCALEYTLPNKIETLTNSILSGDDEFKYALIRTTSMPTIMAQPDMIIDLNTVPTLDMEKSWWNRNSIAEYNIFGKQYSISGELCLFSKGAPLCYFFNKQIVEDLKLGNLYQLVYDGTWTIDKMLQLAESTYGDLNGNSKADDDDRYGLIYENNIMSYTMLGSGNKFAEKTEDGFKLTLNNPTTIGIVEKLVPALNNSQIGLFASNYYSKYKDVYSEFFLPKFIDNHALFFANQLLVALDLRAMDADFGILPTPKYDEAQDGYYTASNAYWAENVIVPATNTELDITGHVLDAMGYYSQQYVTPAFIDETVIGKSVRDDDSANMVQMLYDTQIYDLGFIFNWGGYYSILNQTIDNNTTGFASIYAANESAAIAAIEKSVEQFKGN